MSTLFVRILFLLALLPLGASAAPRHAGARGDSVAADATARARGLCLRRISALCDDTSLRTPESELRALIGRNVASGCYVGLTAGKSWRPLERYGDRDPKLRVCNPTLGLAFRYSF
ncbi:MAG: hypothetical protein K2F97_02855 [Muribaculaceae bacterium]|nr:hypothetical protein [Muribaculaceae bacterium]